ncbi:MAG TPA: carbamoyltransferase [bacterium]|nr:carbamoyltransferase [bacterium]
MYILGISCYYHDASAALLKDGVVVAAAEEERFTRKKHDSSFPLNAINFCLSQEGIKIDEISYVGFYEKPFLKFERALSQHLTMFPWSLKTFLSSLPGWLNEKLRLPRIIKKKIGWHRGVLFIDHHLAHAASSFLASPYQQAAIVTVDGVGEWTTTTYGFGINNDITLAKEIKFPSSVGLLYSTITAYLGFSVNNSEYKVMGLSAYGTMDRAKNIYYQKMQKIIDIKADGSFCFDMSYFKFHYADRMPNKKLCDLLDGPVRQPAEPVTTRHQDIAAAVQLLTEDILTKILNHVFYQYSCENLVLAGGVALNSVYNGKILKNTPFKSLWIQPNASDGGTGVGVALYIYYTLLNHERIKRMDNVYLGPEFSEQEIKLFLDDNKIKYSIFINKEELINRAANLIKDNFVVGWFQKGMEWGPRALGARSILANPLNPKAKELLNTKVKHREKFRPFAPVVCADDAPTYFDCDLPLPEPTDYMLMVYPIKKEWQEKIPSVTHVDGSGRLQTVNRKQNELYYDLIKKFGSLTGIPILINTSFNIRGEPIVCTPKDAYRCMMGTGIDYLVIGNFLIKREDNPADIWDSEKYAVD